MHEEAQAAIRVRYPKSTKRRRSWSWFRAAGGERGSRRQWRRRTASVHRPARAGRPLRRARRGCPRRRRARRRSPLAPPARDVRSSIRFNGFESGGPGDYAIGAGTRSARSSIAPTPPGASACRPRPASGANEYVQSSLVGPGRPRSPTASGPASRRRRRCGARRVRSWLNGATVVAQLVLTAEQPAAADASTALPIGSASTPVADLPGVLVGLRRVPEQAPSGTAALMVDGNRRSGTHFSTRDDRRTRIGPDDSGADAVSVVWDDHGVVRGLTFPTALRIAGLLPRHARDRSQSAVDWTPGGGCASAVTCTDEQPPDGDTSFVSSTTADAMQMFCLRAGRRLAACSATSSPSRTSSVARTTGASADVDLRLRINALGCGGNGGSLRRSADAVNLAAGLPRHHARRLRATRRPACRGRSPTSAPAPRRSRSAAAAGARHPGRARGRLRHLRLPLADADQHADRDTDRDLHADRHVHADRHADADRHRRRRRRR